MPNNRSNEESIITGSFLIIFKVQFFRCCKFGLFVWMDGRNCKYTFYNPHREHSKLMGPSLASLKHSLILLRSDGCKGKEARFFQDAALPHDIRYSSAQWKNLAFLLPQHQSNQITVVVFQTVQLAQASFLQKNQVLQNVFFWYL